MKRGQAAIEFIFLVLIAIVYLTTVVIPLSSDAQKSLSDIETISRTNNETQKIVNAISEVNSQGEGSRQTVITFLPENAIIYCNDKNISFEVTLKQTPYPAQCQNGTCKKIFTLPTSTSMDCRAQTINARRTNVTIDKGTDKIILNKGS